APDDASLARAAAIDLRPETAYTAERPAGSVRLEVDDLLYHAYLLPPRNRPLVLIGGPADRMPLVVRALLAAGHPDVRHFSDETWREHLAVETGPPSRRHLWEPSEALREALDLHPMRRGATALDVACGSGRDA